MRPGKIKAAFRDPTATKGEERARDAAAQRASTAPARGESTITSRSGNAFKTVDAAGRTHYFYVYGLDETTPDAGAPDSGK